MVFDAFFPKRISWTASVCAGFAFISRLQYNAYPRYRYIGGQKGGKGRPNEYGVKPNEYGVKIEPKNISTKGNYTCWVKPLLNFVADY